MTDMNDKKMTRTELGDDALNGVSGGAGPSIRLPAMRGFTAVFDCTPYTSASEIAGKLAVILRERGFIWRIDPSIFQPYLGGQEASRIQITVSDDGAITSIARID